MKIEKEFENIVPKMKENEFKRFVENVRENGVIYPIITWNGIIVDGHHRYKAALEVGCDFETKEMHFDSKEDALRFAARTNFATRKLDMWTVYMTSRNLMRIGKPKDFKGKTNAYVAEILGVSEATIKRMNRIEKLFHSEIDCCGSFYSDGIIASEFVFHTMRDFEKDGNISKCLDRLERLEKYGKWPYPLYDYTEDFDDLARFILHAYERWVVIGDIDKWLGFRPGLGTIPTMEEFIIEELDMQICKVGV